MIYYIVDNYRNDADTGEEAELVAILITVTDVRHFVGGTFCSVFIDKSELAAALTVRNELSEMALR